MSDNASAARHARLPDASHGTDFLRGWLVRELQINVQTLRQMLAMDHAGSAVRLHATETVDLITVTERVIDEMMTAPHRDALIELDDHISKINDTYNQKLFESFQGPAP